MLTVSVLVNVGLPEAELNDAEAPDGRPEVERLTSCVVPEIRVTVIVFEPRRRRELREKLERATSQSKGDLG